MKTYLIVDRHEDDEWYVLDYIGTSKKESIKRFQEGLQHMIELGPDDQRSYMLLCVTFLSKEEVNSLQNVVGEVLDKGSEYLLLCDVYQGLDPTTDIIFMTDGCSDVYDCFDYFLSKFNEHLERRTEEWTEQFNEFLKFKCFDIVLKDYIKNTYK